MAFATGDDHANLCFALNKSVSAWHTIHIRMLLQIQIQILISSIKGNLVWVLQVVLKNIKNGTTKKKLS